MLVKIKSTFFYSRLFCHLNEKIKLSILRYNKYLQKFLDINLINYRIFSGKYIVYEGEGEGERKGEGKRKGKIYDGYNNRLIFEGELLKGEKNGKGKEYDEDGYIEFSGEYLNVKRILKENESKDGFLSQYNIQHKLVFQGFYLNG